MGRGQQRAGSQVCQQLGQPSCSPLPSAAALARCMAAANTAKQLNRRTLRSATAQPSPARRTWSVLPMGKRQPRAFSQCRYCSSWQSTRYSIVFIICGSTRWLRAHRISVAARAWLLPPMPALHLGCCCCHSFCRACMSQAAAPSRPRQHAVRKHAVPHLRLRHHRLALLLDAGGRKLGLKCHLRQRVQHLRWGEEARAIDTSDMSTGCRG